MPRSSTTRVIPRLALVVTAVVGVGVLSLSDRAPAIVVAILERGRSGWRTMESLIGYDVLDRADIPLAWDTAGHLGLWAAVTLAALVVTRGLMRARIVAACVFATSALIEVGQSAFTASRHTETSDLLANGVGVAVGVLVAAVTLRLLELRPNLAR